MRNEESPKHAGGHRAAFELRTRLEQPIHNKTLGKDVGRGELDYEVYLNTQALYGLQTDPKELTVPDELLFQVMHQTQELWLKAASFEVVPLVDALDRDDMFAAIASLERITRIHKCLADEIQVLFSLQPDTFLTIRRNLGNGSGLESPGYNRLLIAAPEAEAAFDRMLARHGVTVLDLYGKSNPRVSAGLTRIAELFLDWDTAFQSWLVAHFFLVRRTLGVHRQVRALDGFPTQALPARMTKPLFEKLWDVRVEMTKGWSRAGGHAPGAIRSSGEYARASEPGTPGAAPAGES